MPDILGAQFDAGHRIVGYPMAMVIRVLVHNTSQPHALLAQVADLNKMSDSNDTMWSRKRMVLAIANKEGGAHIDPDQPVDILAIEEQNSMGWVYRDPLRGEQPMSEGPLLPSIRQVGYEMEHSIIRHLGAELHFIPSPAPYDASPQTYTGSSSFLTGSGPGAG